MARTTRPRLLAATVVSATLLLGGCSFANPIQTQFPYAASDGLRLEIADGISVENLMILTQSEGAEGRVLGAVVNNTGERVTVDLGLDEGGTPVTVESHGVVNFTDQELTVASTGAAPGALLQTSISVSQYGTVDVGVPVLDGTLPPYDEHLPGA